ncbi:MAG TPA: hypothetical protein EYH23_02265 [Euryarchaeota archaeon]|nr:hypothetical protein [Euryarchaeota archaeon]
MIAVVLSGKGGAGKTTVAAAVAHAVPENRLVLADADVDTPNLALALGATRPEKREDWLGKLVAEYVGGGFDPKICPLGAIKKDGSVQEMLCGGCGVCAKKFPSSYRLKRIKNAEVIEYRWGEVPLITAELEPGCSGSGDIITKITDDAKTTAEVEKRDVILIDAAAGLGCPIIASVRSADLAILVVDNTLTGVSDAERAVLLLNHFQIPFYFVINRWDLAPERVEKITARFKALGGEYIGKIPYIQKLTVGCPVPADEVLKHINVEAFLKRI